MHFWQITQGIPEPFILFSGPWMFSQMTPDITHESIRCEKKRVNCYQNTLNCSVVFYKAHQILKKTKKQNEVFNICSSDKEFLMLSDDQASGSYFPC